jgi:small subunit ribosomal protein S1
MSLAADQSKLRGNQKHRPVSPVTESSKTAPVIEEPGEMDYESLLQAYNYSFQNLEEGEVINGTVIKVTEGNVIIDVGFKSEGMIPLDEFRDDTGRGEREGGRPGGRPAGKH